MPLLHIAILALVQGITEFLPISSSGHLLLTHAALSGGSVENAWEEDLILDLAVHVGSLLAVLLYFRRDVLKMLAGLAPLARGKISNPDARFDFYLIVASVPAIAAGFALHMLQPSFLRSVEIVAWCTLLYGILLWVVDKKSPVKKDIAAMTLKDAFLVGCAQALALIPGTSRSGITMTAARSLGLSRPDAARFSFLLSIIATAGAGALGAFELLKTGNADLTASAGAAALFSFLASLATVAFLMRWLRTWTFTPFAVYRIGLGLLLIGLIYSGYLDDAIARISFVSP